MEIFTSISALSLFVTLLCEYFKHHFITTKDIKVFKKIPLTLIIALLLSLILTVTGYILRVGIFSDVSLLGAIAIGVLVFLSAVGAFATGITESITKLIK